MKVIAAILVTVCLFSGCSADNAHLDRAMHMRNALLEGNGCTFTAVITADYGDRIYTFTMDCTGDSEGNLAFVVTDPATISGITGNITYSGGALTFDDNVLAFPLLADEQFAPVCTPWIFLRTLQSGYISGCGQEDEHLRIYFDDSFENRVLHLEVLLNQDDIPCQTDVYWNNRRILSAQIRNFALL